MKNKIKLGLFVTTVIMIMYVVDFIKEHWPAIIASLGFGALLTVALELVINHWDYIKTTL